RVLPPCLLNLPLELDGLLAELLLIALAQLPLLPLVPLLLRGGSVRLGDEVFLRQRELLRRLRRRGRRCDLGFGGRRTGRRVGARLGGGPADLRVRARLGLPGRSGVAGGRRALPLAVQGVQLPGLVEPAEGGGIPRVELQGNGEVGERNVWPVLRQLYEGA